MTSDSPCEGRPKVSEDSNPSMTLDMSPEIGAIVHDGQNKKDWILRTKSHTKMVIIGDSNMRLAKTRGTTAEVHAFPGAHLNHVYELLDETKFSESVTDIVIAVGINHKDWDFKSMILPVLSKIAERAQTIDQRVHFLGVSTAREPTPAIRDLNKAAKEKFESLFIAPLPVDQVSILPQDKYRIHHDTGTVNRILHSIKVHLCQSRFLNE
jgi:hypothetical protein